MAPASRPPPTGTLITVAPTGAEHAKADLPQLPTTLEELVETARRCEAAGASLIHLHIRDGEHRPTLDAGRLRAAVDALRSETDLVVQLSTGGSVHDPLEQRLTVLDAEPDSCSLTCGTTNFGDDVFLNPWGFMSDLYVQAQEREVVPGVRAVRPRPRARAAPAARHPRPAVRRPGARRLRDRRAGRDAGHDRRADGRGRDAPRRGDVVVGDRHRPRAPADHGGGAVGRWAPAGRAWRTTSSSPGARWCSTTTSWWPGPPSSPR